MADYRVVQMSFWTDVKIAEDFTPEDRYFYLYLLTNTHTNLCGCYELSIRQMSVETGYTQEVIEKLLLRLAAQHNVVRYSRDTREVLLVNFHKHNWTTSGKYLKGVKKAVEGVKDAEFKRFLNELLDGVDTVSIPYTYPMDTSIIYNTINYNSLSLEDNDTDKEEVKVEKKVKERNIIPPTIEMVKEYCEKRNNGVNAQKFFDWYESKGWYVGKNKMKDWQAAVRLWEEDDKPQKRKGWMYED